MGTNRFQWPGCPGIGSVVCPVVQILNVRSGLEAAAIDRCEQRPVRNGGRLLPSAKCSNVDFLGDAQRVVQFDAEVSDRAIHLGVAKQELDRSEVASLPIDQRGLGPAQGMRAITAWIQSDHRYPVPDGPGRIAVSKDGATH